MIDEMTATQVRERVALTPAAITSRLAAVAPRAVRARRRTPPTSGHDGRMVADVVADWARCHAQPFTLTLTGNAGGKWRAGNGGEQLRLDALDFCWTLAGRQPGTGGGSWPPRSRSEVRHSMPLPRGPAAAAPDG
jgi:hypothetical protein